MERKRFSGDSIRIRRVSGRASGSRKLSEFFSAHGRRLSLSLVILTLLGTFVSVNIKQWAELAERTRQVSALATESDGLREEKARLEREIERMRTDRGVEGALREDFLLAKPGEEVFVVTDRKSTGTENVPARDSGFLGGVLDFLFFWR